MYEQFYGFRERPFSLIPDPDFLYLSPQHKLAKSYLEYGIKQRHGLVVLTGEIGAGKTTLIKSLLQDQQRHVRVGVLYQTSAADQDLLSLLLIEFKVRGNFSHRAARLAGFNQFLHAAHARGEHVVLIVDEAQNLRPEALEELRLLSNLQVEKEPLMQVILVGQPGLRTRLSHPALRQLAQRVAVHYHLQPLTLPETKEYIRFRLSRAGGQNIFTEEALEQIYAYTQGVPRRINVWCDLALVAGFAEGRQEIDQDFMERVYASQGGSLEGTGAPQGELFPDPLPEVSWPPEISDQSRLEAMVTELFGRVTRLEGLVLEMSGQLIPFLSQVPRRAAPNRTHRDQYLQEEGPPEGPGPDPTPPQAAPASGWRRLFRRWWLHLRGHEG